MEWYFLRTLIFMLEYFHYILYLILNMSLVYESLRKIYVIDRTEIQNLVIRECALKVVYPYVKIRKKYTWKQLFWHLPPILGICRRGFSLRR